MVEHYTTCTRGMDETKRCVGEKQTAAYVAAVAITMVPSARLVVGTGVFKALFTPGINVLDNQRDAFRSVSHGPFSIVRANTNAFVLPIGT
jgi:hypothetical protein